MARFDVTGKVALVTGGARGIGFGVASALARRGACVAIVDLELAAAASAAARLPGNALGLAADVSDRAAMRRAVATVTEQRGGLDVVVANAGVGSGAATVRAMSEQSFDRVLAVNLGGVYNTVITGLPQIVARRGHIVVTSSVYAFANGLGAGPYAVSKAGVEQLGRALQVELAPHGATLSIAYFGFIDTEMVHRTVDADPAAVKMFAILPKVLHKRLSPEQAGEAIAAAVERRAPRVIAPKRWAAFSALRGLVNPMLDRYMTTDRDTQALVRELDAREGDEQVLTA
ncbi:MAG: SDR family NAD(P)-dependent oxidoreductase [Solirubrobacteraceae bacterium]|jgi:NAD(P)-dependent dehydrogenase (short-subunit alcohol dehydrogenase family)